MTMENDTWKTAVIESLVIAGIYNRSHELDPYKAINELIDWHCQVAIDPAVSSDAEELIRKGVMYEREACIEDIRTIGGKFSVECEELILKRGRNEFT